jgi:hypothetical protein
MPEKTRAQPALYNLLLENLEQDVTYLFQDKSEIT